MFAIKAIKQGAMKSHELLEEARIMHRLHHPKLVQLMGICSKGDPVYIITELMELGPSSQLSPKSGCAKHQLQNNT